MGNLKTNMIILALLTTLLLGMSSSISSYGAEPKLAQVVYITMSKACSCTLERCQAGDVIVGNLFNGARNGLLKRIDYSADKDAARVYIKQYRITQVPALLFLDAQGTLLWLAVGALAEKDITGKLSQFGG